jgi:hypothetical protein
MIHEMSQRGSSAITVRNLPPSVSKALREKARKERLSLNKAVVRLLEEAVGGGGKGRALHHDLDRFFGGWSRGEADTFDSALREQREVDPEVWK